MFILAMHNLKKIVFPRSALLGAPDEWKEFTSKPVLKYVLKLLTGISQGHETTQILVSAECIPVIHRFVFDL